jgi:hypothetical protein
MSFLSERRAAEAAFDVALNAEYVRCVMADARMPTAGAPTASVTPLVSRVEITTPGGRHVISADPIAVLDARYPRHEGYELRIVRGYEGEHGFIYHHTVGPTTS